MQPTFCESIRDFTAGTVGIGAQSLGLAVSGANIVKSLFKKQVKPSYKTVLITGASSGIGQALAEKFAEDKILLILSGRNSGKLDSVARTCTAKGSKVRTFACDFAIDVEREAFSRFVKDQNNQNPIDLVIANAAMMLFNSQPTTSENNVCQPELYNAIVDVNIKGILSTVMPLLDNMVSRNSGHIVLLSSINAFLGPANQFLYSATKSFIKTYGQDLQQLLDKTAVKVTVVAPGLVDTNMTSAFWESNDEQDRSAMPRKLAQDPKKFAEKVYKGIFKGNMFITYPYYQFLQTYAGGNLPPSVRRVASKLFTKTGFGGNKVT